MKKQFSLFHLLIAFQILAMGMPLHAAVYTVKDYGAMGNGTTDDSEAIQRAINAATAAGPGNTVLVPAGTYLLGTCLNIHNADHLTFTGASMTATKFLTTPTQGCVLGVTHSISPIIENFCNDGQVLNFTQGTITDYSGSAITVEIEKGYPSLAAPNLTLAAKADTLYTFSDPNRGYDGYQEKIRSEASDGGGRWSLTLDHLPKGVSVGEKIAVWNRSDTPGGICYNVGFCRNPTVRNVTDYCGGWNSLGAIYGNTGPVTVTNYNECPPAGSDRLITSGGGTIGGGNRGTVTFTDCTWRGIDDDCLDFGNNFLHVISQQSPTRITVADTGYDDGDNGYRVGDNVQVWGYAPGDPFIRDTAKITGVVPAGPYTSLTLDKSVTVLKPDPDNAGHGWDGYDRIQDTSTDGNLVVQGGTIQSSRARCLLMHVSGTIRVLHNRINSGRMESVFIGLEQESDEGAAPTGISVIGNTFTGNDGACVFVGDDNGYDIGKERHTLFPAVTILQNTFWDNEQPNLTIGTNPGIYVWPTPILVTCAKQAKITDNKFQNNTGANIAIQCCQNVTIRRNIFVQPNASQPWPEPMATDAVVSADNVQGLMLIGNIVKQPGPFSHALLKTTATVTGITRASNGISVETKG